MCAFGCRPRRTAKTCERYASTACTSWRVTRPPASPGPSNCQLSRAPGPGLPPWGVCSDAWHQRSQNVHHSPRRTPVAHSSRSFAVAGLVSVLSPTREPRAATWRGVVVSCKSGGAEALRSRSQGIHTVPFHRPHRYVHPDARRGVVTMRPGLPTPSWIGRLATKRSPAAP